MILQGVLISGKGEAQAFTKLEWLRNQMIELLQIDPYPGTLNLELDTKMDREEWKHFKANPGISIFPPETNWCGARCYPARLMEQINAMVIVPEVENYPENQLEIMAAVSLRKCLHLTDGDRVTVEVKEP